MSRHHQVVAAAYPVFKGAKALGRAVGLSSKNSLRVLTYHDVAPEQESHFASQLRWLARSWRFVSAEQFAALVTGDEPFRGRNLLLTFDDGFASSRRVAEHILAPLGIRALFFPVTEFVSQEDRESARLFIAQHIQPGHSVDRLPGHLCNMTWSDLEFLLQQGHTIGAHTRTHARLSDVESEGDLEFEILSPADTLANRLGISVDHFAYTFGDVGSFSPEALAVARRRFRFIYSGLRGDNVGAVSPLVLWRDAIAADDQFSLVGAYLEGAADFYYTRSRRRLRRWI
jgi:peptidoglycan/xylan/chitin deacetylase (PgdA/CDA1 family)